MAPFDSALSKAISEALYGHNIQSGTSPIDDLIAAAETQYIEWSINNPKFQALVVKVLGKMPTMAEWRKLFEQSKQSIELKSDLLHRIRRETPKAQTDDEPKKPQPQPQPMQGYEVIPTNTHADFLQAVGKERYRWDIKKQLYFDSYRKTGNIYVIKKDGKLYAAAHKSPQGLMITDVRDNPLIKASSELQKILDNLT